MEFKQKLAHIASGCTLLLSGVALFINVQAQAPEKSQIAFYSNRDGNNEIYVMDADGNNLRRLTNDPSDDYAPVWSPDGRLIAFHSDRDGNPEPKLIHQHKFYTLSITPDLPDLLAAREMARLFTASLYGLRIFELSPDLTASTNTRSID